MLDKIREMGQLLIAIEHWQRGDKTRLVDFLRDKPHVVNRQNGQGQTILHMALQANVPEASGTQFLLKDTRQINRAMGGDPYLVELFLDTGADVNLPDKLGRTSVHIAAVTGIPSIMQLLLRYGADVHIKDRAGNTPQDYARATGAPPEMLSLLISTPLDGAIGSAERSESRSRRDGRRKYGRSKRRGYY